MNCLPGKPLHDKKRDFSGEGFYAIGWFYPIVTWIIAWSKREEEEEGGDLTQIPSSLQNLH